MAFFSILLVGGVLSALAEGSWYGRSWYGHGSFDPAHPWRSMSYRPWRRMSYRPWGLRFPRLRNRFIRPWTNTDDDKQDSEKPLDATDPNVCTVRKPLSKYRCHKKRMRKITQYHTEYKCCPGFKRIPGKPGCPEELYVSTKNIAEVAKELGLNRFLKYAGKVSVAKLLRGKGPYTVFMPSDEAFAQLPKEIVEKMKNPKYARYYLQYHVVEGKHVAESLKNGMNLTSYEFNELLRVSASKEGKRVLLEGANVSTPNQGASNGIIHVIDRVLTPPRFSIMEVLERDDKGRFTILKKALDSTSLNLTGQLTLFAPTDEAFEKLSNETMTKIFKNKDCLEALLKHHIVRGYLFSQIMRPSESMKIHVLEGSKLHVKRNESGDLMINTKTVSEENIRASDGVIHVIDDVLLISSALDLVSLTEHLNLTEFSKILKLTNLAKKLEGTGPYTIFAPTNEAIEKLPSETKQLLMQNPTLLRKILEYHVVEGMVSKKQFTNDQMLETLDKPNKLRINLYWLKTVVSVEGSCVKRSDICACNGGILHVIEKVLMPPTENLLQILDADPRLSLFRSMITDTNMLAMLSGTGPFTIFAPSDDAIEKLRVEEMDDILKDNVSTAAFIRGHMVHGTVYSSSVTCQRRIPMFMSCATNYFSSLQDDFLTLQKCKNQALRIDDIKVNATDIDATNGVIHVIGEVLTTPVSWFSDYTKGYWG